MGVSGVVVSPEPGGPSPDPFSATVEKEPIASVVGSGVVVSVLVEDAVRPVTVRVVCCTVVVVASQRPHVARHMSRTTAPTTSSIH